MLSKEQEEKVREIARDIAKRAADGEFGWRYGVNRDISWEELQGIRKNTPPTFRLVDGKYISIKEET